MPESIVERLSALQTPQEYVFRSRVAVIGPLIGAFRTLCNGVSAKWYVLHFFRQQSHFNALVVQQLSALEGRLDGLDLQLEDQRLHVEAQRMRLEVHQATLEDHRDLLRAEEAWLIRQDRELTQAIHDLAELSGRVAQSKHALRGLQEILEGSRSPDSPGQEPT